MSTVHIDVREDDVLSREWLLDNLDTMPRLEIWVVGLSCCTVAC